MVKAALKAPLSPEAEELNCLLVPASLHCRLVQLAVPLPAAVPMSKLAVPSSDPEPLVKATLAIKLAGSPTVEKLPNGSWAFTTGCVAKGEPVRDGPPGCVVKVKWLAAAGPTTRFAEVALVKPVAVKLMLMVSATL